MLIEVHEVGVGVGIQEKSPAFIASVGTKTELPASKRGRESRIPSYPKKKNVLSFPLYIFGMRTGPPTLPPGRFEKLNGRPWPLEFPKKSLAAMPPGSIQ